MTTDDTQVHRSYSDALTRAYHDRDDAEPETGAWYTADARARRVLAQALVDPAGAAAALVQPLDEHLEQHEDTAWWR